MEPMKARLKVIIYRFKKALVRVSTLKGGSMNKA